MPVGEHATIEGFTGVRDGRDCTEAPYAWVIDTELGQDLEEIARSSGAVGFGVTSAEPFTESRATLENHISAGYSGPLRFTYDDPATATDVTASFPWARSVVSIAAGYGRSAPGPSATGAVVARFAITDRYDAVRTITTAIGRRLLDDGHQAEALIDDNRLVDRAAAARSGVGWIGKSTIVLAPGHGPWMLLGSVVTNALLEPTPPMRRDCGTCVACIPACPTGAITDDGLDARRCISTWLQSPGSLPLWIRPHIGRRIYGCDDCLTSCPPGGRGMGRDTVEYRFIDLLALEDDALLDRFSWWYVPRREGRYLRRNILVAAGNSREDIAFPAIVEHLDHPSSMIRGHAAWAIARSRGREAEPILREALGNETVKEPKEEIENALAMIGGS